MVQSLWLLLLGVLIGIAIGGAMMMKHVPDRESTKR